MKGLPDLLTNIISDDAGNVSSMRVSFLLVLLLTLGPWAYVCCKTGVITDIPDGVRWVIGIMAAGKLTQKNLEAKAAPESSTTTNP